MTDSPKTFADLGVDAPISAALEQLGITNPFPIQELTLPLALSGADVIGQARTGTGKTLAFGIPLLQATDLARSESQALVVVPTRELCLQVHSDLVAAGSRRGVRTVAVYGGKAIDEQSEAIAEGAQVVVGTPGRLLDMVRRGLLKLGSVSTLVLDEADEMLDMGFLPDVEQLIQACATKRQTMLFSATMPSEVVGLARRYMHKPTFMRADVEEPQIGPATRQVFLSCHRMDKPAVLARILQSPERGLCVVFTRTKRMADTLVTELADHGVTASAIHSNLRQEARERTMDRFRRGKVDVLCATEVAARGLDITSVTHVVNYDCPDDEKMYLHRIGRTGRAGAAGVAVTLAVWNEQARLEMIKKALDIVEPTHEVFSTSPELEELFDLPPRKRTAPAPSAAPPARGGQPRAGRRAKHETEQPRAERRPQRETEQPRAERRPQRETEQPRAERQPEQPGAGSERETEGGRPVAARSRVRRRSRDDAGQPQTAAAGPVAEPSPPTRAERPAGTSVGPTQQGSTEPTQQGSTEPPTTAGEPDTRRRRVRTRARPSTPADATERAGKPSSSEAQPAPVPAPQPAPSTGQATDAGGPPGDDTEPPRQRRPRSHQRGSRRDGRDRRRKDGDQAAFDKGDGGAVPPARPRGAQQARGGGKPALRRPLVISHLP